MDKQMQEYMLIFGMLIDSIINTNKFDELIYKLNRKYNSNYRKLSDVEFYI